MTTDTLQADPAPEPQIAEPQIADSPSPGFRHVGMDLLPDPVFGGQIVAHQIEALGPQPAAYRFFAHYMAEQIPGPLGLTPKTSSDLPDSRTWRAGQRFVARQMVRLAPGSYKVAVGFATAPTAWQPARRMPIPGSADDRLPLGSITIETPPANLLQPPHDLLPANLEGLLTTVLAIPATPGDALDHLAACMGQASMFGHVLEFGVAAGHSINRLAALAPHRTLWGFDTFEGLPEEWDRGGGRNLPAGYFSQGGQAPAVRSNVRLIKGLLQETLPVWLQENPGNLSFLHVDVDLYSAARAVLDLLNHRIVPGTVVVFDDVAAWLSLQRGDTGGYDLWMQGEWKALHEWVTTCDRSFAVTSRTKNNALAIRVLR